MTSSNKLLQQLHIALQDVYHTYSFIEIFMMMELFSLRGNLCLETQLKAFIITFVET
jgi:hypothetical protein